MAFQNIKRNGQNWTVESADQLNQMTEKIDLAIDSYETRDLEYQFKNINYFKNGYRIGNNVVLNGTVNDGDKIPYAPTYNDVYATGTENSTGKQVVVKITTKGKIVIKDAKDVSVFAQWVL